MHVKENIIEIISTNIKYALMIAINQNIPTKEITYKKKKRVALDREKQPLISVDFSVQQLHFDGVYWNK